MTGNREVTHKGHGTKVNEAIEQHSKHHRFDSRHLAKYCTYVEHNIHWIADENSKVKIKTCKVFKNICFTFIFKINVFDDFN